MIFIVGCGRSGTHFLANILKSNTQLAVEFEPEPYFTQTLDVITKNRPVNDLLQYWQRQPAHMVVKIHPTMWLYDHLPHHKFILIERHVYQVVASGLNHSGVMNWLQQKPSVFNGGIHPLYRANMRAVEKLTLKWLLHKSHGTKISRNPNVLRLKYEDLLYRQNTVAIEIQKFLNIAGSYQWPHVKFGTTTKWQVQLTPNDIKSINTLLRQL